MGEGAGNASGSLPLSGVDCPDGLARCSGGSVQVSRLAAIPQPCQRPPPQCDCPWEAAGECEAGCVAEGVELVVERSLARTQLCAPGPDGGAVIHLTRTAPASAPCDEGQLYRCSGADVIACHENAVVGSCLRGCFAPDAAIPAGEPVSREAAFALLCSR